MARIVFTLTTAQVKALLHVSKNHAADYGDYGATRGLVDRGLVSKAPEKKARRRRGYYYSFRDGYKLTTAGKHAVGVIRGNDEGNTDRATKSALRRLRGTARETPDQESDSRSAD